MNLSLVFGILLAVSSVCRGQGTSDEGQGTSDGGDGYYYYYPEQPSYPERPVINQAWTEGVCSKACNGGKRTDTRPCNDFPNCVDGGSVQQGVQRRKEDGHEAVQRLSQLRGRRECAARRATAERGRTRGRATTFPTAWKKWWWTATREAAKTPQCNADPGCRLPTTWQIPRFVPARTGTIRVRATTRFTTRSMAGYLTTT